jgi:hypothetical protein
MILQGCRLSWIAAKCSSRLFVRGFANASSIDASSGPEASSNHLQPAAESQNPKVNY